MRRWGWFLILVVPIIFWGGCTVSHQARLYDLDTGDIILIDSLVKGNRSVIKAVLPTGEKGCGECMSGGEGFISWGSIYGTGYFAMAVPLSQRGVCILVGENGTVIECEFRVSSYAIRGHGICRDNRGRYYKMMF